MSYSAGLLVLHVIASLYLKTVAKGELQTKDGKTTYSFKSPFIVEYHYRHNFNNCIVVNVNWHYNYNEALGTALSLFKGSLSHAVEEAKLNFSARMPSDRSAVNSSMSGYVEGRNENEMQYNVSVSLSCISFRHYVRVYPSQSIQILLRYCPQSPQPLLKYEMRRSFNDLSKVYCDDGADLHNGTEKISSNESTSKCGPFGEWLDNFSCWFVPRVQLKSLPASFYKKRNGSKLSLKGDQKLFFCNVSEGYPIGSSVQLWIGDQMWPINNYFTMVRMTELHNNETVYCTASNKAGIGYSSNMTLIVYFPPILESRTLCLKSGESSYSIQFSSNPPQNRTSLRFLLQVSNFTNVTIEGIWEVEQILKYGTWLQKFTATINLTENSSLFFEYDKHGNISFEKLDIVQNCLLQTTIQGLTTDSHLTLDVHTTDDYATISDTANDVQKDCSSSMVLYAVGVAVGLWLLLTVPGFAILLKQRQALAQKVKDSALANPDHCISDTYEKTNQGGTTEQPSASACVKSSADTTVTSPYSYENVSMSLPYEDIDTSSRYETITT